MRRGEIYWVDFEPSRAGEIRKRRPVIVLSNDRSNQALNSVQVVSLTTNVSRVFPWEALVRVNGEHQKALADQLRTVAKEHLSGFAGVISPSDMVEVERAIKLQLGLP